MMKAAGFFFSLIPRIDEWYTRKRERDLEGRREEKRSIQHMEKERPPMAKKGHTTKRTRRQNEMAEKKKVKIEKRPREKGWKRVWVTFETLCG